MGLIDKGAFLEKMKQTNRYFSVKFDVEEAPEIDPVHYAGGCYCRECQYYSRSTMRCFKPVDDKHRFQEENGRAPDIWTPNDFCSYGRRREATP